jgi:hypothetical protein
MPRHGRSCRDNSHHDDQALTGKHHSPKLQSNTVNGFQSAMRVEVKGLHSTYKHLASGETRVYWYAWRGGPRLKGKLGTAEFMASYHDAIALRPALSSRDDKAVEALVDAYLDSQNFLKLRDRTQADCRKQTRVIVAEFGSFPLAALAD